MTCVHFSYGDNPRLTGIFSIDPTDGPFRITVGKRRWWFEWSERWGPLVVRRTGATANQPGWRSLFWRAACIWAKQGKRTNLQNALWHEPPPVTHYYRMVCKRRVIVASDVPEDYLEGYSAELYVLTAAQGIEAGTAETLKDGSVHESPVPKGMRP